MLKWFWSVEPVASRNAHVCFRRCFELNAPPEALQLHITAESRYVVWCNGVRVGKGPGRAWPEDWTYDSYDLVPWLHPGNNAISILVNFLGEGTLQYIPVKQGGLGVSFNNENLTFRGCWRAQVSHAHLSNVPRMCMQMAFEEHVDGREDVDWLQPGFDDSLWPEAIAIEPVHDGVRSREIPLLADERVPMQRLVTAEEVRRVRHAWTINLQPYVCANNEYGYPVLYRAYLFTRILSPCAQEIRLLRPHWYHHGPMLLNGREISRLPPGFAQPAEWQVGTLREGWNTLVIPLPDLSHPTVGHSPASGLFQQFSLGADTEFPVRLSIHGEANAECGTWAFLGPFEIAKEDDAWTRSRLHESDILEAKVSDPEATVTEYHRIWEAAQAAADEKQDGPWAGLWRLQPGYMVPIKARDCHTEDLFIASLADAPVGRIEVRSAACLGATGPEWAEVMPASDAGNDVRLLVDFGTMMVGDLEFEVEAADGTRLEFHGFEFIQRDGRRNYAEGMSNVLRYTCRGGRQQYRSVVRRGMRYAWITIRRMTSPVRMRGLAFRFESYPQLAQGSFSSSDCRLDRIWQIGAHTLRCCAEDTYTDCPTYEQVCWVGDARNEALVDWMINGDNRLWLRCLRLAGLSLRRSPLVENCVPAATPSLLPAWSFLWMRSCREYLLYTGDKAGASELLEMVRRNVRGIVEHLDVRDLFSIRAWNMFDWAEMDTPIEGVVTHNNCSAVLALEECAELAGWLEQPDLSREWSRLASRIRQAINCHLWSDKHQAYLDCIHSDGQRSTVFSQQSQTLAMRAAVPGADRLARVRQIVDEPPDGFVVAGSPFFRFFTLETMGQEGRISEMLSVIRRDWGYMVDEGADTFWEMWSLRSGRLTRSHCHGWSAAPTFFLSQHVLGIHPIAPGFSQIRFEPRLGDLEWAKGVVPTPHGPIVVHIWRDGPSVGSELTLPPGVTQIRPNESACGRTEK